MNEYITKKTINDVWRNFEVDMTCSKETSQ